MNWVKSFLSGCQYQINIFKEDTVRHGKVKENLKQILEQFPDTDDTTRRKVGDIKSYFKQDGIQLNNDDVVATANSYVKEMEQYSDKFYKYCSILDVGSLEINTVITNWEDRIQRFRFHGKYVVVIGAILVAGFVGGKKSCFDMIASKVLCVFLAFVVGILVFAIFYICYLHQLDSHLKKWKGLKRSFSQVPATKEEIESKASITRDLFMALERVEPNEVQRLSRERVRYCDNYLEL